VAASKSVLTQVFDLRLSFIWFETNPAFPDGTPPSGAELPFLGQESTYVAEFNKVLDGTTNPKTLGLPWVSTELMTFWQYYIKNLSTIDGAKAWKRWVPLRRRLTAKIEADWFRKGGLMRFFLEGFYYPQGQALVATAVLEPKNRAQTTLKEARELAFKLCWDKLRYSADGHSWESLTLKGIAELGLAELRDAVVGPDGRRRDPLKAPFSVVTIVQGAGADAYAKVQDETDFQMKMWELATWTHYVRRRSDESQKSDELQKSDFDKMNLQPVNKKSPPGHMLYGNKRGRVIWSPQYFMDSSEEPRCHKLGHYHRNLVFCSLQVESLGVLVSSIFERMNDNRDAVTNKTRVIARNAANLLSQFYGHLKDTYQSCSARVQIEQNDFKDAIDFWRHEDEKPPLR